MSKTTNKYSPEVRDRAVRMVRDHRGDYASEWEAIGSIAAKIGCTAETLRRWCREEARRRAGPAAGAADDRERIRLLEAEANYYAAIETSIWSHDSNKTASGKPGAVQLDGPPGG